MEKEREVITFDYKTVRVKREMETMTTDAYENLGWEFVGSSISGGAVFHVNLSFKRNRKISDKQKMLKIQEKVDLILQNIETLQGKRKSIGVMQALTIGIIGTLTFGGGMSLAMILGVETIGYMLLGISLGMVGALIASLAWPIYKRIRKNTIGKIDALLEDEYNKLADICEEIK